MPDATSTQNQHYVPQFILRRFHNADGRLHVYDKWTRRSFVSSTRNVASENGFYNVTIDDTVVTLEPAMCEIEDAAITAINSIKDSASTTALTVQDKNAVAYFLATQVMRTRSARDMLKQMQDGLRNVLPSKNIEESQLPPGILMSEEELKVASLINLSIADELMPQFLNKVWLLNQTPAGNSFFISDNPVVRRNENPQSSLMGNNGLSCPGIQIHIPLSPSLTLSFICETLVAPFREHNASQTTPGKSLLDAIDSGQPLVIPQESVPHLNFLQVAHANRFIFASHDDFSLVDKLLNANPQLAKPPQIEVR